MPRTKSPYGVSEHAVQRYMERFRCRDPFKARETLNRRARKARPLPPVARGYARGEALLLRDDSLVMVMDPAARAIVTCYPYEGGSQ
ncbi:hypothetical protein [Meiothermus sp. CFH 77666]|uniref:hypothetical protein n=1 Tax=Meiothermus sp. CFH 77666 TaxID=2817942 RepID=UPI001AA01EC2|nr:hypothetical protein [Meiothermus sp. CFH 77666]MBO1438670.1 hypothetical protein [Meiothermus sp. CFH 77666]